jgi:hypothetical protein
MMNKLSKILCAVLLARLLLSFAWSVLDKAPDSDSKAAFTVSSLLDGTSFRALEQYYADTYPNRDQILEKFDKLEEFYGFDREKTK